MSMSNTCPLCHDSGTVFYDHNGRLYYQCKKCEGIFMDKQIMLGLNDEKQRYEEHKNDVNNRGYQSFVSPITQAVFDDFSESDNGLDFGAGTGPVISKLLTEKSYNIVQYDPFFHNYPKLLEDTYNYIVCCEVIEHFYNPDKEFNLLFKLLKPQGKLYCMTHLYDDSIDFHTWYYKNDMTHVFIYTQKTIKWIKSQLGFSDLQIEGRLITFTR